MSRALGMWCLLFFAACNEPIVFDAVQPEPDKDRLTDAAPEVMGTRDASFDAASDARDSSIARDAAHENEEHDDDVPRLFFRRRLPSLVAPLR